MSWPFTPPVTRAKPAKYDWLGSEVPLKFEDAVNPNPMVYAMTEKGEPITAIAVSALDASIVAQKAYEPQPGLGYWPDIRQISPKQRYEYLLWLAQGRREIPVNTGYFFIFYYGLEYRALNDKQDFGAIFTEVQRLLELNEVGPNRSGSITGYGTEFLWFLALTNPKEMSAEQIGHLLLRAPGYDSMQAENALCWFGLRGEKVPDWAAYQIAMRLPQSRRGVVLERLGDEQEKVFIEKFRAHYPGGMPLRLTTKTRDATYKRAAGGQGYVREKILNAAAMPDNVSPLFTLWNESVESLRELNKLKKSGEDVDALARWEALPEELRKKVDHPLTDRFFGAVSERTDEHGFANFIVAELAVMHEFEERPRLTARDAERLVETASHFGYSIEPDVRLTGENYRWEDAVMLYLSDPGDHLDLNRYRAAAAMTRLGMSVAFADKQADLEEVDLVVREVGRAFQLSEAEARRLKALAHLLQAGIPDTGSIGKLVKGLSTAIREQVGKLLLYIIAADGVITKDEIRATRSAFVKLGYTREDFDRQLEAITAVSDDAPVIIQGASARPGGEKLPPPPAGIDAATKGAIQLNYAAIASILAESQEAARLLADAIGSHVPADSIGADSASAHAPDTQPTVPEPAPTAVPAGQEGDGPPRYGDFYRLLIVQHSWAMADVTKMARAAKIPLAGALEALNDWASEKYGGPLFIEDGDSLVVEISYLN